MVRTKGSKGVKQAFLGCFWLGMGLFSTLAGAAQAADQPADFLGGKSPHATSTIPQKREFPVNEKLNPCDDFYQYACSTAMNDFKLREDRSRHLFAFDDSRERLLELKKNYLSHLAQESNLGRFGKVLSTVYQGCMNEAGSKKEEVATVKDWVTRVQKLASRDEFLSLLGKNIDSEDPSFFGFFDPPNFDDPLITDFVLIAGLQTLPERSYYQNQELIKSWQELLTGFFKTIGMDSPEARAKSVVEFEKEFSQTFPLPAEFRELFTSRSKISKSDLVKQFPNLKFDKILKRVPDSTLVRDLTPKNFEWLNSALGRLPLDTLKNVFLYHALTGYLDDAYPDYFKKSFEFSRKFLGGPNQRPNREERCTMMVMQQFLKELDYEVIEKAFKDFPADKFVDFAERVRGAIVHGLEKNTWLSAETKKAGIEKMREAKLQLVKPLNDEEWRFNPLVEYSVETPYLNLKKLERALHERSLEELKTRRNPNVWGMGPLTINAYYSPSDNKFVMPLGILQPPMYDPKRPESMNFGGIGVVIGHELGHGIDDQGAKFDSTGRLRNWFTEKDLAGFKSRGERLIRFYDQVGVNGKFTQGENIGDLVGITFAFQGAFGSGELSESKTPEYRQFFLSHAHTWCGVLRPKEYERRLKTDPHSPSFARVNEVVRQQEGFQKAFACKKGDRMYVDPTERVKIW